jgi:hypothetical protein
VAYLDQMPPVTGSDLAGVIRQHDPHGRYVTVERIDKLVAWLGDLSRLLIKQDRSWIAPRKRRQGVQPTVDERV